MIIFYDIIFYKNGLNRRNFLLPVEELAYEILSDFSWVRFWSSFSASVYELRSSLLFLSFLFEFCFRLCVCQEEVCASFPVFCLLFVLDISFSDGLVSRGYIPV